MTEFLIYQGKAAIALAVFYLFYRLLLSKETFHRFNRIVLLGTAALSFVLPLCVITFKEVVVVPAMTASSETFTGEVAGTSAMVSEVSEPIWPVVLCSIFALGALAVLVHIVISIIGIRRMIRIGSRQALESGETLIITETDTAPFSWMKYIVISREDYESGYSQILTHEKAHIALRHSWDILFVDMITALQWFNPAIWMLKADLRALHEFEADDAVLRSGANIKEYQYLLIRKAVSKSGYSVANSFNHSTLKARITMMLNKKSSRMSAWKALYVIPLVGISLAATAETRVDYQYEDQTPDNTALVEKYSTPVDKDTKKSFKEKNLKNGRVIVDEENDVVTMIYYGLDGKERQSQITGLPLGKESYFINGSFATKGAADIALEKDPDAVLLSAFLKNGKNVRVIISADYGKFVSGTIDFIKEGDEQPKKNEGKKAIPFQQVAQKPGFNGGDANEFSKYVAQNVVYPESCRQSKIEGRVTLEFTVTETGKVGDIRILRSVNSDLDREAVRVVAQSPIWTPGRDENGEVVPVKYTFPVIFKLPDSQDSSHYLEADVKPTFNGGDANEFAKWVYSQLKYPEECMNAGITGRVSLSFIVGTDGKVRDVKVLRGAHEKLDAEAMRVLNMSPDWTPGTKDGKPVPVSFTFPVNFEIPDSENK